MVKINPAGMHLWQNKVPVSEKNSAGSTHLFLKKMMMPSSAIRPGLFQKLIVVIAE